jgi:hypothetical protein
MAPACGTKNVVLFVERAEFKSRAGIASGVAGFEGSP